MAEYNTSPNMGLQVPNIEQSPGPDYAVQVNNSLNTIDSHNHSPGSGVQITPDSMNINAALTFNNFAATNLQYANFYLQTSDAPGQSLYIKYGSETPIQFADLWYNDGVNPAFQITSNGAVYAPTATISGITYSAGSFIFQQTQSSSTAPANLDAGSLIIRPNTGGTAYGVTISPNSSLASAFTLSLPASLPSVQSFMTLDSSGDILAPWTVDGSTITIVSNQLTANGAAIAPSITATQAQVNTGTSNSVFITPSTLAGRTNVALFNTSGSYTWTAPTGVKEVILVGRGGSGGGGGGGWNNGGAGPGGGGGGGGAVSYAVSFAVTPGDQYIINVGAGGVGGAGATSNPGAGSTGQSGFPTTFYKSTTLLVSFNNIGVGGVGGTSTAPGAGGSPKLCFGGSGGSGGTYQNTGGAGTDSTISTYYGSGGVRSATNNAGGGGGGAGDGTPTVGANYTLDGAGGGTAAYTGTSGHDGSNGIGGGGGQSSAYSGAPGAGGAGSDGSLAIIMLNVSTLNTNT